jgi:Stress responsive A/B Barrel Domain
MLIHLVSFKYKAGTPAEARADHRRQLAGLAGIDGVVDLRVGEDVVKSARSYDTGLMVVFPDRAALDAYQRHPQHVPVAQLGAGLSEHVVAVDFEY